MHICVGNLAFTTTEQDLRQRFEPYGTVETIRIMTDRETGRTRGFGFVGMPDDRTAHSAIDALNGMSLAGRALTVNEARPLESRPGATPATLVSHCGPSRRAPTAPPSSGHSLTLGRRSRPSAG